MFPQNSPQRGMQLVIFFSSYCLVLEMICRGFFSSSETRNAVSTTCLLLMISIIFFSLFQVTMGPSMVKEVFGGTGSEIKTLITLALIL